ncbi:pentapeptide repeat-containing protein [Nodosilinea sp. LEGE 07088]|uniref:pentapeptide repeat-containing protein n=1 Tax=Nodosilinea sp. LEGE 07088 TaxID=2777968 RepID=UPI0018819984|nr:pentapeptide repeat-containing protein [Nodosilinea sp. LEGE 07088]MBE9135959.1 pentapeptide repeat-containing protein [Nodosilinea sp. LEGE 07088]
MTSLPPDSASAQPPTSVPENGAGSTSDRPAPSPLPAELQGDTKLSPPLTAPAQRLDFDPSNPGHSPAVLVDPAVTSATVITVIAVAVIGLGLATGSFWLTLAGSMVATVVSIRLIWPALQEVLGELSPRQQSLLIAIPGVLVGILGLMNITGINRAIVTWGLGLRWDILGALGDFIGAIGQIFIAFLALFVAWRQYVISRDLTRQQNLITQQQTIDAYFQGISELVLDDEGLLEDWPQERIIAEARTAAILGSADPGGKAKVVRFLSRSKLLTPLRRDNRLGRAILDGRGGYEEDRINGTRVIDLGAMLAAANLAGTDLRWADLSEANLIRADLRRGDLVRTNFARAILYQANLAGADLLEARLFYGDVETATPRTRTGIPDYTTGANTGAVVEGANFSGVYRLSADQRRYICAWGGEATRATVPGGCADIPNLLGR